jgi:hypothetical protein
MLRQVWASSQKFTNSLAVDKDEKRHKIGYQLAGINELVIVIRLLHQSRTGSKRHVCQGMPGRLFNCGSDKVTLLP